MKRQFLASLLFSGNAIAGNFAECILDKMPGSTNGATHAAVFRACTQEHPGNYEAIEKGSGRGLFGFKDQNACTIKKARDTPFPYSAGAISIACGCLYSEPFFKNEFCVNPFK